MSLCFFIMALMPSKTYKFVSFSPVNLSYVVVILRPRQKSRGKILPPLRVPPSFTFSPVRFDPSSSARLEAESVATAAIVSKWCPQQLICIEEEVISWHRMQQSTKCSFPILCGLFNTKDFYFLFFWFQTDYRNNNDLKENSRLFSIKMESVWTNLHDKYLIILLQHFTLLLTNFFSFLVFRETHFSFMLLLCLHSFHSVNASFLWDSNVGPV